MIYINGVAVVGDMFKATYDADDDGRVEKDALEIALNKLLRGAGPGADPTEIDVPAGLACTELAGGEDHNASGAVWEDWDLSAIVPAGAVAVLIGIGQNKTTEPSGAGARKNGTALTRFDILDTATSASTRWELTLLTECDANRVIDIYGSGNFVNVFFCVLGYWS